METKTTSASASAAIRSTVMAATIAVAIPATVIVLWALNALLGLNGEPTLIPLLVSAVFLTGGASVATFLSAKGRFAEAVFSYLAASVFALMASVAIMGLLNLA